MSLSRDRILRTPRLAMQVRRYHTWPMLTQQTIGDHVGNSLLLYLLLFGSIPSDAAHYIVCHDLGELVAGDPPFPVKVRNPTFKQAHEAVEVTALARMGLRLPQVSEQERIKLKLVDLLDMLELGLLELHMGNKFAQPIVDDVRNAVADLLRNQRLLLSSDCQRVHTHVDELLELYGVP